MRADTNRLERDVPMCAWGMRSGILNILSAPADVKRTGNFYQKEELVQVFWLGWASACLDLKVERKLSLNAKNFSGGRMFSDLKLWLIYSQTFRDLCREPIYQLAPWLLHKSIPAFIFWLFCWFIAIWFKSEFDSDTLVLYFAFRHHFRVRGWDYSPSRFFQKSRKCPTGWIKRPHVLQILQIWTHKLTFCSPQIRRDERWDKTPHGSVQVCVFIRLSLMGLFLVNREAWPRMHNMCFILKSHICPPTHWFLSSSLSLCGNVEVCVPTAVFLIPRCMFALQKYQLFISTCLYFTDSTMEFMGGNLHKSVWETPWWQPILDFFCIQEFMLTN